MTYFYLVAACIGFILAGGFGRVLILRVRTKTFVGEGTDPVLLIENKNLNDLLRYAIAGLFFLAVLYGYDKGGTAKGVLRTVATFVFLLGFLIDMIAKRKGQINAFNSILGRCLMVLAMMASTGGLIVFLLINL